MTLALYRKYRSRTFSELIGQEHVTEPLSQALRSGRLHHAYLFSGPRGCGKTSSARILARSLNCEQGPTPDPCGQCQSCQELSNNGPGSVDVIEIDAASHGGVDDARELRERAFFTPVAGRYKIYVIDEAHMVSSAGFNALLKLVEEPPEFVKFVFATTEPEKVLPTIKSRTHHYPFRLVPPSVLRPYLEQLCEAEGVAVEPAVFPLVVRAGGGSVRDSLSVLDQLIAGAGAAGVTYQRAATLLGVTDAALIDEYCDALAAGDGAGLFGAIDRVAEAGHDARRFAGDLLERLRDLIILRQVPDAAESGLLDTPADQLERMAVHASQLGLATLSRCADIVHNGLVEMRGTASPRLLLELICARMLLPGADAAEAALQQRLEQLERRLGPSGAPAGGAVPAPASTAPPAPPPPTAAAASPPPPAPVTAPATPVASSGPPAEGASAEGSPAQGPPAEDLPAPAPPDAPPGPVEAPGLASAPPSVGGGEPPPAAAAGAVDVVTIRRLWEEIVATVGRGSKRAAAVVREASVRDLVGDTIVLHFQHAVHANMLTASPQPLLAAITQVLGGRWQVRCESGDGSGDAGGGRRAPAPTPAPAPAEPAPPATSPAPVDVADWPELAQPGGAAASPAVQTPPPAASTAASSSASGGPAAAQTTPSGARPASASAATSPPSPALPAAGSPTPPRLPASRTGRASDDERAGVDEVADARVSSLTTEQHALRLLQQGLPVAESRQITP